MSQETDTIFIYSAPSNDEPESVRRGLGTALAKKAGELTEVATATLEENMHKFLKGLNNVLEKPVAGMQGFTLDTVEVSVQIDGKGNVGLWALGSAELAAHGGLKLILKKK